ncbi:MAG: hypothetical protein ACRDRL_27430 [Sciscionella sp.]
MLKTQIATVRTLPRRGLLIGMIVVTVVALLAVATATGHGAIVFGILSFAVILAVALGVLWYTAREHRPSR